MIFTERNGPGGLPVVVSCRCFGLCRGVVTGLTGDVLRLSCRVTMVSLGDAVSLTVAVSGADALMVLEGTVCGQDQDGFAVRLSDPDATIRNRLALALRGDGALPASRPGAVADPVASV